jgi:hypothetical protein
LKAPPGMRTCAAKPLREAITWACGAQSIRRHPLALFAQRASTRAATAAAGDQAGWLARIVSTRAAAAASGKEGVGHVAHNSVWPNVQPTVW